MPFRSPAESPPPPMPAASAALLDALQRHLLDRAVPALDGALADLDDYLFDRSQTGEEALGLMALRDMRRVRGQVVQHFKQALLDRFRALREGRMPVAGDGSETGLSLLSEEDLEEQLAVEQLASSVLRTHAAAFDAASRRLSVVLGRGPLLPAENPLAPAFLAEALGWAMGKLGLDAGLRIVAFKFFERALAAALGEIYERCNALMLAAGILPELRVAPSLRPSRAAPAAAGGALQAARNADAPREDAGIGQVGPAEQAMFADMLAMLQGWRSSMGLATPGAAARGPALPTRDLLSILSLMQQDGAAHFNPAADAAQSLAGQLRQQMAQSARKLGVTDDNLNLEGLDGDAVDLVALLFDVLLDGPQYDAHIRQMIGRMLVPYVKVAVKDRRLFLFKEHPARRLLNTVAEACEGNRGEAPQERELLNQVDHTIDRLVAEFNEDVAIFETLEQELRAYMAQHRKRFELAERRTAEAQRGRERLERARKMATDDLDRLRAGRVLPPVLGEFLDRHVCHHLTQVALRDGHGAPRYNDALRTAERLLDAHEHALSGQAPGAIDLPEAGLRDILASVGCVEGAAQAAIDALHDALARRRDGQEALADDVRLPPQLAVPEPPAPEPQPQLEVVAGTAGMDFDAAMLERIRQLKIGDWLQLASADSHFAPAKVSWISPISSRLLLVNRRGIRVLVASVEELAVMAKLGKLALREGGNTAFEEAMHQVVGRLQRVAEHP